MKKNIIVLFLLSLTLFSCQKEDPVVTSISLPSTFSLDVGTTKKITVSHLPSDLSAPAYSWQTSDASIITVDNQGNINALQVGEATLTARADKLNLSATSKVTILPIHASSIEVNPESTTLLIGESIQLEGVVLPENATDKTIIWKSENESVITVSDDGLVKAVGPGKARVTATSGTSSGYSEITVNPILAETVILSANEVSLFIGSSTTLTATIEPENTTDKEIIWSTANDQVAKVSDGIITGAGAGKTIITASCGDASSTCEVSVEPVKVTEIRLSDENLRLEMSDVIQLSAIVIPEDATNKKVNWITEDANIAEVDENGLVAGISEGTTKIIATAEDGNFSAFCDVVVTLKGLILTKEYLQMLPGTTDLIHVLYSTNEKAYLNATWTSSNPNIAIVTGDGIGTNSAVIEAKELGTTTITATSSDGTKSTSCTVEVLDITNFIDLSFITYSISIINGFVYGDIYSRITNNSEYPIELTSFYTYDGYSGQVIARQDPTEVGKLSPGENTNLGTKFNSVYYPIFKWNFRWNDKDYSIQHQYLGSTRSTNASSERVFKIEALDE